MNKISLTVPMTHTALIRAGDMLHSLADDIMPKSETEVPPVKEKPQLTIVDDDITSGNDAPPAPTGVELDKEGIPWDARIHAASKVKLAKTDTWKLKRGMGDNPTFVEEVKTELRAAMAVPVPDAGNDAPPVPTPDAGNDAPPVPTPDAPVTLYNVSGTDYTKEQLQKAGWSDQQIEDLTPVEKVQVTTMTFPELLAKITANSVEAATVTAAVNKSGLASIQLLAARPDLIPAVDAELFTVTK